MSTPRPPVTRDRVVREAVAIADEGGIDAVSMRSVADRLGVVPMALYKHVADKDDLVDAMVDEVIGEFDYSEFGYGATVSNVAEHSVAHAAGEMWRPRVRAAIMAARQVVAAHPWARRAIETRTRRTPAVLGHMEAISAAFLDGGVSADLTHHVMHMLGNRIWGFSPELFNEPVPGPSDGTRRRRRRTSPAPVPGDYPAIVAISEDAAERRPDGGCDEDFEFGFALDVLLDAIERLQKSGWTSPKGMVARSSPTSGDRS